VLARRISGRRHTSLAALLTNIVARLVSIACVALATLVVARTEGAAGVGSYALLRVLPGLVGVVVSCGLPGAVAFFLAGSRGDGRRLPFTIVSIAIVGGFVGSSLWLGATPALRGRLFPGMSGVLVAIAGVTVLTQLIVATAKSCSQGSGDMRGANIVIINEEFMFLPAYGLLQVAGAAGPDSLVAALIAADVLTFTWGWARLARRGFFHHASAPSPRLARRIAAYGLRAQIGGIMTLLNLRLDFIILSLVAGPAVLGVYAVASKFAELVKVPGVALTYVLYPQYSRDGRAKATVAARRLMPRAGLGLAAAVVPLWPLAGWLIPSLYGAAFTSAVTPTRIILLGLVLEGVAGVISAYLYGVGRPGLNSWAMAVGLAVTVVLDLALIPRFGSIGAAVASAVTYLSSTLALIACFWSLQRRDDELRSPRGLPRADLG
jgi:O-antigen/teichoic acid export membrane protein